MEKKLVLAICDDDVSVLEIVSGAIVNSFRRRGYSAHMETFKRATALEARMETQEFDLVFLDIDMPGMDGITFARKLRTRNSRTDVIFISSREDKVFEALRTQPSGFIRKSRFIEDVSEIVGLWLDNRSEEARVELALESAEGTVRLPLDTVLYIEGDGKVQKVVSSLHKEPIVVSRTMQEFEDKLSESGFLRIHKSLLVNYRYIRRMDDTDAVLTNGEKLPMSRRRVQEMRTRYMELMQDSGAIIL